MGCDERRIEPCSDYLSKQHCSMSLNAFNGMQYYKSDRGVRSESDLYLIDSSVVINSKKQSMLIPLGSTEE
jgi:hypothetical protein